MKELRAAAKTRGVSFALLRQQGAHDIWVLDDLRLAIPRHRDIPSGTCDAIRKDAQTKLGERWWR